VRITAKARREKFEPELYTMYITVQTFGEEAPVGREQSIEWFIFPLNTSITLGVVKVFGEWLILRRYYKR
jgi:hypothetical protein